MTQIMNQLKFASDANGVLHPHPNGDVVVTKQEAVDPQGFRCVNIYLNGGLYAMVTFGIDGTRMVSSTLMGMEDNHINNLSLNNIVNAL